MSAPPDSPEGAWPGSPAARLLDLSRLVARAGRGPLTGVDRVEYAYLSALLARPEPLFALVRSAVGFLLLDRAGAVEAEARIAGRRPWGPPDLLGRLSHRRAPARARAEADIRRLSIARARPAGLARMLRRRLPEGTAYLNLGHENLSSRVFDAVHALPGGRAAVMIHDTIPIDHPEFAAAGVTQAFSALLSRVGAGADLVLYNSADTRRRAEAHLADRGRVPPGLVAPLGHDPVPPEAQVLPPGLAPLPPYFVTVGTIEPRKNHALLLDLWEELARDPPPGGAPGLCIVGRRGWRNAEVFARLDALPPGGAVREIADLSDGALAALMAGSAGLLFPSHAEGYGLPPIEAAALGVPVLCNDLPVYRETVRDYAVYADVSDRYRWLAAVRELSGNADATAAAVETGQEARAALPWEDHFNRVFGLT